MKPRSPSSIISRRLVAKTKIKTAARTLSTSAKSKGGSAQVAIDIDANRRLLNRYRFVQHESMRILAGWLPRAV